MAYLADDLLTAVKRDGFVSTAQGNFTDPQILAIGDEQITDTLAPLLVSLDGGWFREVADTTLVASQAEYAFPRYAMWGKFFRFSLVDSGGNHHELQRIDPAMLHSLSTTTERTPRFVYVSASKIVLVPTPDAASAAEYTLRAWIYRRPGRMVASSSAAVVQSVNTGTGVVTYTASPPSGFTSSSSHDFYGAVSPFVRRYSAVTAAAAAGSTQTFPTTTLPDAGDYVCKLDETVYPAVPIELHAHLKDLIIASLARSQMDREQWETLRAKITERARTAVASAPGEQIVSQPRKFSLWDSGLLAGRYSAGRRTTP